MKGTSLDCRETEMNGWCFWWSPMLSRWCLLTCTTWFDFGYRSAIPSIFHGPMSLNDRDCSWQPTLKGYFNTESYRHPLDLKNKLGYIIWYHHKCDPINCGEILFRMKMFIFSNVLDLFAMNIWTLNLNALVLYLCVQAPKIVLNNWNLLRITIGPYTYGVGILKV